MIVESPAKATTIKGYLGGNFKVVASKGHVRDLPKSTLGINIENGYEPKYINIRGKGELINALKKEAKNAGIVYLATDPDREGEAISWHLAKVLGLDEKKAKRVTFNEITKSAVRSAITKPREIDMDLVNSQQARRILDRIVGYKLSPFLWSKVKNGLSAGRVQTVATRLVVEREKEIRAFKNEEFWTIDAIFETLGKKNVKARFYGNTSERLHLTDGAATDEVIKKLESAAYRVSAIRNNVKQRNPAPPFTTSLLQQEAYKKLGFTSQRTMKTAQELYEGISVGKSGEHGLITYMRTDSMRISDEARDAAKAFITDKFGEMFYPETPRVYKSKGHAQDAHEAIRPVDVNYIPEDLKANLSPDQYKLYKLIWDRFVASQMASAIIDAVSADIAATTRSGEALIFKASGETVRFKGFLALYEETKDDAPDDSEAEDVKNTRLPAMHEGDTLSLSELTPRQNFTQPPLRYSEATLIKALEEKGIGRPSTYTPTLTTIITRGYIERKGKTLVPTSLGEITTELMVEHFAPIVDYKFTATMEDELDNIADGKENFKKIIDDFYKGFAALLENADKSIAKDDIVLENKPLDIFCENCGAQMILKQSRYGKFAACPNYPKCRYVVTLDKNGDPVKKEQPKPVEGMTCPLCGGQIFLRKGRFGEFYACENYPKCRYTKQLAKDTGIACPKCGGKLVQKRSGKRVFYGCDNYPQCDFSVWDMPTDKKCPLCGAILVKKKGGDKLSCSSKGCKYTEKEQAAEQK